MARKNKHTERQQSQPPPLWGRHAVAAALDNPAAAGAEGLGDARGRGVHAIPGGRAAVTSRRSRRPRPAGPQRRAAPGRRDRSRAARGYLARRPARGGPRRSRCCWCSIRSPTRIMSARSCARPRHSERSGSSPRTATRRPKAARSPRPRRVRSSACPGCASSTSRARSTRSARPASGASASPATRRPARRGARPADGSRWCSARRGRACARTCATIATRSRGLPISDAMESLNVSNAAAVALYAASGRLMVRTAASLHASLRRARRAANRPSRG